MLGVSSGDFGTGRRGRKKRDRISREIRYIVQITDDCARVKNRRTDENRSEKKPSILGILQYAIYSCVQENGEIDV